MFHGSYRPGDVEFLLKPIQLDFITDLQKKEALIQSGKRHYSEMLSPEKLPSEAYFALFHQAHDANLQQLAHDCLCLAQHLHARFGRDVVLVSLARAGTPIGVILHHLIDQIWQANSAHYSVSIIRDRGIDQVALRHILARGHRPESIAFIDGWTGKGVISRELAKAVGEFNRQHACCIDSGLYVLTDLAGTAACAASSEDYLIASSILNAPISGLISRSVLNEAIGPEDFHGCVYYHEFTKQDLSQWFVDSVLAAALALAKQGLPQARMIERDPLAAISSQYMQAAMQQYGVKDVNLIKPGIGEATRVLLRRQPERVILRGLHGERVAHLVALAQEKSVRIEVDPNLPYHAVSIIRSIQDA